MSEQAHVKDWYVAQVVVLTNENKRLRNEVERLDRGASAMFARLRITAWLMFANGLVAGYGFCKLSEVLFGW